MGVSDKPRLHALAENQVESTYKGVRDFPERLRLDYVLVCFLEVFHDLHNMFSNVDRFQRYVLK